MAVKKFRARHTFSIVTDHASLRWLMSQSELNGRLARWALKLQAFDFSILHNKGTDHVVPDALSRLHSENLDTISIDYHPEIDLNSEAFEDQDYVELRNKLSQENTKYPDFKVIGKFIYHRTEFYRENSDLENQAWKLNVPSLLRVEVVKNAHDSAINSHSGVAKTTEKVKRHFYWPNMIQFIEDYISKCLVCKTTKHPIQTLRPPMGNFVQVDRVFQKLFIDLIGPFPRSKNDHIGILIVLDQLSKLFSFSTQEIYHRAYSSIFKDTSI